MRLAWIGPAPTDGHGVAFAGANMLRGLARAGIELDCFVAAEESEIPDALRSEPNLSFFCEPPRWHWGRWYSRTPLVAFLTGQSARALAQARLASLIARRHAQRPYELLYQFSQIELGAVRLLRRRLPPIVLHPEVHAAGELNWLKVEAELVRRCEPGPRRHVVRAMLELRSWTQRRDMRLTTMVVAPSRRFAEHLQHDYGLPPERLEVVANPIDLERFFAEAQPTGDAGPLTILFVSRIAVRKGVEMVVSLSHRLADLADQVRIEVVGEQSLWSDYRPLLEELNPRVANYFGGAGPELPELYRSAALLMQPAHYEPFALTVGEALASGRPVVTSDEVGASEGVDSRCCRVFPAGDLDALEAEVRGLVNELRSGAAAELGQIARSEAERLFEPSSVGARLAQVLRAAARKSA